MFKQETLTRSFLTCFKKGGSREATLAARALGLHVVTLGAGNESEYVLEEAKNVLYPSLLKSKAAIVRNAAIEALSMISFVASKDPLETLDLMAELTKLFATENMPPEVQETALRSWAFLFTTISTNLIDVSFVERHLKLLSALLYSDSVGVRSMAGEAIGVIWSECDIKTLPASKNFDEGDSYDEREYMIAQNLEDIVTRMQDLAVNRGDDTRRSKKDRINLKSTFRELTELMDGGEPPEQRLKLRHGDVLVVNTTIGNIQLNFFRRFLAEGLQVHLLKNELLHEIFDFAPREDKPETLTKHEKRIRTSIGKARSHARDLDRLAKYGR